jgi:predicted O-linked N-acetylglucosamine transferase (SPINDLY family)
MALQYPRFADCPAKSPSKSVEPIRIGFVSGYFYNHSIWKIPIKGWIKNLNKEKFELFGYYTWRNKDIETETARQFLNYFVEDVYSFEDLCNIIKKDNLHLLIFPEIGMDPITLKLASLKLAPIQCVSWGHPTTSGLPTIDYYLSSDLMEPPDGDSHYTEELVRLPNLSAYYEPPELKKTGSHRDNFGLHSDRVLYHCCQSLYKYLPQYDEVFPRIAQELGTCTFLFSSHARSKWITEKFQARINQAFEKFNLDAKQFVVFLPFLNEEKYNDLFHLSDILLDPIGWSGCNSALEAISCDLPVMTLPGKLMRSRDSFGIFNMMGVHDTIAFSIDEYIGISIKLGKDSEWRKHISKKIADNKHRIYFDKSCITALEKFIENSCS